MTAKCTAQLLADLRITPSLGRRLVSNDNLGSCPSPSWDGVTFRVMPS